MAVESFHYMDRMRAERRPFMLNFAFTLPHLPGAFRALKHGANSVPDHRFDVNSEVTSHTEEERVILQHKHQEMYEMRQRSRAKIKEARMEVERFNAQHPGDAAIGPFDIFHNTVGIRWLDSIVGEFIDYLARHGELDNTLVLFTADHGIFGKGHCVESGIRVPLIVHCPRLIPKPVVVNELVANFDIGVSILDAVGGDDAFLRAASTSSSTWSASLQQQHQTGSGSRGLVRVVDGRSFMPLVSPMHRHYSPAVAIHPGGLVCEIYSDRAIITKDYALIDLRRTHYLKPLADREHWAAPTQLYSTQDVEQDRNLLAGNASRVSVADELLGRLDQHIQHTAPLCQKILRPHDFPSALTSDLGRAFYPLRDLCIHPNVL